MNFVSVDLYAADDDYCRVVETFGFSLKIMTSVCLITLSTSLCCNTQYHASKSALPTKYLVSFPLCIHTLTWLQQHQLQASSLNLNNNNSDCVHEVECVHSSSVE